MQKVKLKADVMFSVLYVDSGEVSVNGEKRLKLGVVLEEGKTPMDIETAFTEDSQRLEVGYDGIPNEEGTTPFEVTQVFQGYTKVVTYTVERNMVYDVDKTAAVVHLTLQEPDLRTLVKEKNDEIMLALCEVYELVVGGA